MRTIDGIIHPLVELIDFCAMGLRIYIHGGLIGGNDVVECGIEYPDDLRAFVIDDCMIFLVPKYRHGESGVRPWKNENVRRGGRNIVRIDEPARVIRIGFKVEIADVL